MTEENRSAAPHPGTVPPGTVTVETAGTGKYVQRVHTASHDALADEPKSVGGDDLGLSPYDYLLAALGACTNMTLQMYAERKGWPLESVATRLTHAREHVEDCEGCEDDGRLDVMTRAITLSGDLSDAQITKLMQIADKCPVHKTLTGHIEVRTTRSAGDEA